MGSRVSPSQPEKNIEQVQGSPSDQVGKPTDKNSDTTKWILKNIKANACLCNEESDKKSMCHFGKNLEKNVSNADKQQNESDTELTNYFGEIRFGKNCTAKYIRVHSTTTELKNVLTQMNEKWKLEIPNLLIYVHDSMNNFENTYQTSLTKAVQGTGAWIITDGKHKYVNIDETADEQPIIIGISQWGAIHNKHQMDNQQDARTAENCTEKTSLSQAHSHFILIDDGSGDPLSTKSKLESEITKLKSDYGVPTVLLVFEGDNDSKRTVYGAPESNIPVVIVKKSDQKASGTEKQSDITEDISTSKVTHICKWNADSCDSDLGLAILHALLKDAKNNKITSDQYHLKLFEIAKNISIDTILQQEDILKSCLMTAILRNKVEYVNLILDNDFDLKTFLTDANAKRLQELCIEVNVTRLLDHVRESIPQLRYLKNIFMDTNSGNETDSARKGCASSKDEKLSDSVRKGCSCFSIACCTSTKDEKQSDSVRKECSCFSIACCTSTKDEKQSGQKDEKKQSDDPWLDLFVWSVLNKRTDMAKLFLRRGKPDYIKASTPEDTQTRGQTTNGAGSAADQDIDFMMDAMAAALFAHALLSAMSQETDEKDLKEKCEKDSGEFNNLAIRILNEGYKKGGVNLARKLLIQQLKGWENTSCVLIAVHAKNKQFISEYACQDVFNNIWMGKIVQETGSLRKNLKLLLCIFFPLLILFWIKFRKEDTKPSSCVQDSSEQRQEPTIWKKIKYFYQAPVVICFNNVILYMLFLGLYSYTLMTEFDRYLSWLEILLCVWVFTIFIHEVIQVRLTPSKSWKRKLSKYIMDGWNFLDIVTLFLFLCGMILRIFDNKHVTESAHVVHGVTLITFYLRLLQIFSVHRELGPKLVMIIHMVYNIVYFFMILVVFIVAYGIASHSILYPQTEPSFKTFTEIFRRPYWNIYGELMLDKFEGSADCTNDPELYKTGTYSRCPTESGEYFVPLLFGVYMLMCNILLLNLLIAMFSSTFEKVEDKSYLYWSFQQYSLINEYANRPFLVPPFIILSHLCQLIQWIRNCCKDADADIPTVFCKPNVVISDKDQKMVEKFDKNGLEHIFSNVSEADSANLAKRMEQMDKKLNWIVTTLMERNRGAKLDVEPVYHVPVM